MAETEKKGSIQKWTNYWTGNFLKLKILFLFLTFVSDIFCSSKYAWL